MPVHFPRNFAPLPTSDVVTTNTKYRGWNANAERLFLPMGIVRRLIFPPYLMLRVGLK